jgi:hypothetical protein
MGKFSITGDCSAAGDFRVIASASSDLSSPSFGDVGNASDGILKLVGPELPAGAYHWGIQQDGVTLDLPRGTARVPGASHRIGWSGCNVTGSNAPVFAQIASEGLDGFFHLGDSNYNNRTDTTDTVYVNDIRTFLGSPNVANLASTCIFLDLIDDHNGGGANDHEGNTPEAEAAASAYRKRFHHPNLELSGATDGIYFSHDIGRVRHVFTDQRRYASPRSATDNASKTILGATQKAWLLDIIENSPGMLIVWWSTRTFHANQINNHDRWGGFTTERTEICDHIRDHASGRVVVLHSDRHQGGVDNGTNCDYASTSDPIICAMAGPLDQSTNTHGGATFSSGVFSGNGQYGVLEIADTGGSTIQMDIAIKNSTGGDLTTLSETIDVT